LRGGAASRARRCTSRLARGRAEHRQLAPHLEPAASCDNLPFDRRGGGVVATKWNGDQRRSRAVARPARV